MDNTTTLHLDVRHEIIAGLPLHETWWGNGEKELWLACMILKTLMEREKFHCSESLTFQEYLKQALVSTLTELLKLEGLILITDKNKKNVIYLSNLCRDGRKNHFSEHDYTLFDNFSVCPLI